MDLADEASAFVEAFTARASAAANRSALAQWKLATEATVASEREAGEAQLALAKLFADSALYRNAKRLDEAAVSERALARQLRLVHLATLGYQREPVVLERIVAIETELESTYSTHRAEVLGASVTENDVRAILRTETDEERRRLAWEASKGIGPLVAPRVVELARLRNQVARALGYASWFAFSLALEELDEGWLMALLDEVDRVTEAPFRVEKARIDAEASSWLGVAESALWPWHYQDPFFQEAPTTGATSLEPLVEGRDVVALARAFYDELGFGDDVAAILSRSDLYPRDKKTQHAFCSDIDRQGDVRILCNVTPSERWLDTVLHELGHGIYDCGVDRALPWILRTPTHIFATEAIAMMMGRRTRDPSFVARYLAPRSAEASGADRALLRRRMLLFTRWVQVMTRFERELYREPVRDAATLGAIWWELVERYQLLRRPPGDRSQDFATKIHVALAPVYYQNYLLGELTASQLEHALEDATGQPLVGNASAARLLRERYFAPGASLRWDALIEHATGRPLSLKWFVGDFVA